MRTCLLWISLLCVCLNMSAQTLFPRQKGDKARFTATIEMKKAYVSGICILLNDGDLVKGSLFNEFGISALDFTYSVKKDKVKILNVIANMDKWYIKRVLKKDLRAVMHELQNGKTSYANTRYQMNYSFKPLETED